MKKPNNICNLTYIFKGFIINYINFSGDSMKAPKFRCYITPLIFIVLFIYHLLIAAAFILPHFLWKDITSGIGVLLIIIDIVYLLPLIFNTYYVIEDKYLFIRQWPLTKKKIRYTDIFIVDNDMPEGAKAKSSYHMGGKSIIIGYYTYDAEEKAKKKKVKIKKKDDDKAKEEEINPEKRTKNYVAINPSDTDLFLIKLGSKFTTARALAKKLEEERKEKNAEHYRKKSLADRKRKEKEEAAKPVNVEISTKLKTDTDIEVDTETQD